MVLATPQTPATTETRTPRGTKGRTDAVRQAELRPRRGTHPGSALPLLDPSGRGPTPASRLRWIACGRPHGAPATSIPTPRPPDDRPDSPVVPPQCRSLATAPAGAPFFSRTPEGVKRGQKKEERRKKTDPEITGLAFCLSSVFFLL